MRYWSKTSSISSAIPAFSSPTEPEYQLKKQMLRMIWQECYFSGDIDGALKVLQLIDLTFPLLLMLLSLRL